MFYGQEQLTILHTNSPKALCRCENRCEFITCTVVQYVDDLTLHRSTAVHHDQVKWIV